MTIFLKMMRITFLILMRGLYKYCVMIELIHMKELILFKVVTVNNVLSAITEFLIMGFNSKIIFVMVVMIWQCCILMILEILLLLLLKVLVFKTLAYQKHVWKLCVQWKCLSKKSTLQIFHKINESATIRWKWTFLKYVIFFLAQNVLIPPIFYNTGLFERRQLVNGIKVP